MKIADINPNIRFAEEITYSSKGRNVYVKDCRLFYIISGIGKIFVQDNELLLAKNTLFYCRGGIDYIINTEKNLHLYSLNFDLSQSQRKFTMPFIPQDFQKSNNPTPIDFCDIKDSDFLNSFFILSNGAEFKNSIAAIVNEYSDKRLFYRETCSTALKNLIIDLHKKNYNNQDNSTDTIKKIIEYINLNYAKEIKNNDLAEIAGYHEYHLNRLFVRYTGMSMHKYIVNLRMNEAKRLLLNTNMSVSDIASQTGFCSNTHFSTYFKKETKVSPFEYRNNFKNKI